MHKIFHLIKTTVLSSFSVAHCQSNWILGRTQLSAGIIYSSWVVGGIFCARLFTLVLNLGVSKYKLNLVNIANGRVKPTPGRCIGYEVKGFQTSGRIYSTYLCILLLKLINGRFCSYWTHTRLSCQVGYLA